MKQKAFPKLISLAIVASLGAGGYLAYGHFRGNGAQEVKYQSTPVQRGRVVAQVTATGTLQPRVTVQVGSQVSGRILQLTADFNTQVKKGQLLAKLDPQLLDASVTRALASQTSASAALGKANALKHNAHVNYTRAKTLAAQNLVAKAEVDSAWATYESAKAQVTSAWADLQQAKAAVEQAKTNQAFATIVSPIDGVVISRDVDVGQTVAASLSAPTLFTIAESLEKMQIHTSVAESDVGKVQPNQEVNFTVDAFPNERFDGVVKQIRYSPKTESNVVTYDAVITVENKQLKLRPGMTANVTFIVARKRDALLVPNAALRFQPPADVMEKLAPARSNGNATPRSRGASNAQAALGQKNTKSDAQAEDTGTKKSDAAKATTGARRAGRGNRGARPKMVWIMDETGTPKPVRVVTGITDGSVTEIVSGELAEGDKVIIGTGDAAAKPAGRGGARGGQRGGQRGGRMGGGRFL